MASATVTTPVVNGSSVATYNQDCPKIVIGAYAVRVLAKINGALTQTNEDGVSIASGGQNGARLTNQLDLYQVQLVIDFYENVKNSVAIPAGDVAPTIPVTAEPTPPG